MNSDTLALHRTWVASRGGGGVGVGVSQVSLYQSLGLDVSGQVLNLLDRL